MAFKIDIHNHILPTAIPDFKSTLGEGGFITLKPRDDGRADMVRDDGVFFRTIERNCFDPLERLKDMKEQGVDVQVLSTVPVMFSEWAKPINTQKVNRFLNENIAETCKQHPKNFVGLGTVPLNDPKLGIEELRYCINELGLKGVQLGSHYGELNLNDKSLFPFYEEAQKLGAALLIHPWDMMGKETMPDYWLPWLVSMPAETSRAICCMIFGGVFETFPDLRVCFAHGGGSFPHTIGRIEHGFNMRPDLCAKDNNVNPREYLGKFYIDSVTHDPRALNYNIDLIGENSIMLGTDYPFPLGEQHAGLMIEGMDNLSHSQKDRLLHGSALEWLNMKLEDFN
jgi:aminocarboxymuconate-semialdehyde decarboxylase